jgi:N-acetyl sugar amidotransferase
MYCTRCIYDDSIPDIFFDLSGVCNYCYQIQSLADLYKTGQDLGIKTFENVIGEIKKSGEGKKYDCVIGVSGGTDSSYLLHLSKIWGLRPLAVHYDNTWNTAVASSNMQKVLSKLNIDLYTFVLPNRTSENIVKSFFKGGVPELDAATDLAYAYLLRKVAAKKSIKYILEGHSFLTEGLSPLGKNYFDGRYIKSIVKEFGGGDLKSYPLMTFSKFLYHAAVKKTKFVRPFWYLNYDKEEARQTLSNLYNWEYYGGHHLENRITAFLHTYYLPTKFNVDMRFLTIAADVRAGKLDRQRGIVQFNEKPTVDDKLISYFIKRINVTTAEFRKTMSSPPRYWYEFPTYKRRFEKFRIIFKYLAKKEKVSMSFYTKYCVSSNNE